MSATQLPRPDAMHSRRLLRVTAELVQAAVQGRTAATPDLGDLQDAAVDGCFVTLKRDGQLRSCCGIVAGPHPLPTALAGAAWRAACDDPRFAPIDATELEHLDLELHLLHNWATCSVPAPRRMEAVRVGEHGLVLRQGSRAGLLLPAVAVEHGWDALTFLEQTCRKAGLPPGAWQRNDCSLECFQARHLADTLPRALAG